MSDPTPFNPIPPDPDPDPHPGSRAPNGGKDAARSIIRRVGVLPICAAAAFGLLGGLGAFTFGYGEGAAYLKNDPASCANCHVMQDHYNAWLKSSHHNVATCNDCHLPHNFVGKWMTKADNGFFHSLAFTTNQFHEPIQIKDRNARVTQHACLHCHEDFVHSLLPATEGADMLSCVHCHSDVGHAQRR